MLEISRLFQNTVAPLENYFWPSKEGSENGVFKIALVTFAALSFSYLLYSSLRKMYIRKINSSPTYIKLFFASVHRETKGNLYLKISKAGLSVYGEDILGDENYKALDKSLTSSLMPYDGLKFYDLRNLPLKIHKDRSYEDEFETDEENSNKMRVKGAHAVAEDQKGGRSIQYRRVELDKVKNLFKRFQADQAQVVPFLVTKKPEDLFKTPDDEYIYVIPTPTDEAYGLYVYRELKGKCQKYPVTRRVRPEEGGGTLYMLDREGSLYSASTDQSLESYFEDSTGRKHPLERQDVQKFDYSLIGI